MIPITAYADFESASTEVLDYLHSRLGFNLWMVTRKESNDWIVLNANDHGYGVQSNDVFTWTDSFCSFMVEGLGPRIAPRSDDIPVYASALIGQQVEIGAYVGVPLLRSSGELFGTLCAIDPSPMPEEITGELPMIEMMARLLTTILETELRAQHDRRLAERAHDEAVSDKLTGLFNRRGWDELLAKEYHRCNRYGHAAGLVSIDLDELKIVNDEQGHAKGDELLCRASSAMILAVRESDVVARLGGDEFAILAVECNLEGTQSLVQRLNEALENAGVSASIGMSMWHPSGTLTDAWEKADENMYQCKSQRKARRKSGTGKSPEPHAAN